MQRKQLSLDVQLPQPPRTDPTPLTFVLCPASLLGAASLEHWLRLQWVYQQAFAEAQAVIRPSLLDRDLLAAWN